MALDRNTKTLLIAASVVGAFAGGIFLFKIFNSNNKPDELECPVGDCIITSPFGNRINPVTGQSQLHNGDDFKAKTGDIITAPANGKIISVFKNDVGGNQLLIKHANGFTSGYAHLSAYLVKEGDNIKRGQSIARAGATGQVTGPHLHFTLRDAKGNLVDPKKYLV